MALGFGFKFGFANISNAVSSAITWLLPFNLGLSATVGDDAVMAVGSVTNARVWDATVGLLIVEIAAGEPVSEAMRWTGTEFVNNDGSGNKLTPSKTLNGAEVMLVFSAWSNGATVPAGGFLTDFDGVQNKYYSSILGGVTSGTGVANDTGVTDWVEEGNYNNVGGLTHILNEPAATNLALQSQDFGTTWLPALATVATDSTTAPNGTSTADTLGDDGSTGTGSVSVRQSITTISGQSVYSVYAKQKQLQYVSLRTNAFDSLGSSYFDLLNGVVTNKSGNHDSAGVEYAGNGWWRCWITFTTTSDLSGTVYVHLSQDGSTQTVDLDGTSDIYIWQADLIAASAVSTPIPTTTGTVTRDATEFLVTPDTEEFLRLRFADVITQSYMSSGTIDITYDGTTVTVTDGVNAMTHVVAMAVGDQICVVESTGELYYNGSLVDTNGSYAPTWGEIALGNATDYTFSADLDPTDTDWNEPV